MIKLKTLLNELTPDIDVVGTGRDKTVMANNTPLKDLSVEDVRRNIVMFRNPTDTIFPAGFTLVYFMDSEQAAQDMKDGKIPYLMVPRGTFHSGGSPITDIWKKAFQRPGTEHILGMVEANSNDENIFLDMVTVRPKYQKNTIAKKMVDIIVRNFPNATISHSSTTDKGEKFVKSYRKDVPPERWKGRA